MFKKMTSLLLALVLLFTMAPAAFAVEESTDYEMEQYFSITEAGTIYFDTTAAAEDGVAQNYIAFVQENINDMNYLVEYKNAYVTSNFHVVLYASRVRTVTGGVTKTEVSWDGATLIYLNSDDTEQVIAELEAGESFATLIIDYVDLTGILSYVYSGLNQLTIAQLRAANRNDTGVVIKVKLNLDTGGQDITIWPQ